jgi:hypothetical protein
MKNILKLLEGGDRRSIGHADRVAALASKNSKLFPKIVAGLWSADRLVRMRAADAMEKVTRERPALLRAYRKELLGLMAESIEAEVRWHLAVMVPRLSLDVRERELAVSLLLDYLKDRSSIVRTFALQGLADLALQDASLQPRVVELLRVATRDGTAAMKARSRKLLTRLERG